jgi:hypothetical protein
MDSLPLIAIPPESPDTQKNPRGSGLFPLFTPTSIQNPSTAGTKQEGCCRICRSRRIVLQQPLLYDNKLFVLHSKTLLKAIDTAARVYQLLLSGEERMAL